MEAYRKLALELGAVDALLITPRQIYTDRRVILKCLWGCEYDGREFGPGCGSRGLGFEECREIIDSYQHILLVHNHDARALTKILLEIERRAFLDGLYLAFTLRKCKACKNCAADQGHDCLHPEKVRPCDQAFGIDVYRTARELGLPCEPLQNKGDVENRYGFALLA